MLSNNVKTTDKNENISVWNVLNSAVLNSALNKLSQNWKEVEFKTKFWVTLDDQVFFKVFQSKI